MSPTMRETLETATVERDDSGRLTQLRRHIGGEERRTTYAWEEDRVVQTWSSFTIVYHLDATGRVTSHETSYLGNQTEVGVWTYDGERLDRIEVSGVNNEVHRFSYDCAS